MPVEVLRPLKLNARKMSQAVREEVADAVGITAFEIEAKAKIIAPIDTGFLRDSIRTKHQRGRLTAIVSVGAEYGIHVEEGTQFQSAQPFLRPAVSEARTGFESRLAKAVARGVQKGKGA